MERVNMNSIRKGPTDYSGIRTTLWSAADGFWTYGHRFASLRSTCYTTAGPIWKKDKLLPLNIFEKIIFCSNITKLQHFEVNDLILRSLWKSRVFFPYIRKYHYFDEKEVFFRSVWKNRLLPFSPNISKCKDIFL